MLLNAHKLYGKRLSALDGEIGQVKDFYFDDKDWVIRYLIADTSSWLSDLQVLISPRALGKMDPEPKSIPVGLTRKQIEGCPPIATQLPVSRQYEEQYHRYYGMPYYWEGNGLWNMTGIELQSLDADPQPGIRQDQRGNRGDPHLRSMLTMKNYRIQARDGAIGQVSDFLLDDENWTVVQLVIDIGHWYAGKTISLIPQQIERISYEESTIFVSLSLEDIRSTARNGIAAMSEAVK